MTKKKKKKERNQMTELKSISTILLLTVAAFQSPVPCTAALASSERVPSSAS